MNQRTADRIVALVIIFLFLIGLYGSWRVYQRSQTFGGMTGSMMGGTYGVDPLWHALATVLGIVVVGGVYLAVRKE